MIGHLARSGLVALATSAFACGHGAAALARVSVPGSSVEWPSGEKAVYRLAFVVENRPAGESPAPTLRRVLDAIAGTTPSTADDLFRRPFGLAALADGGFVVADPDAARVQRFGARGGFEGELTCGSWRWEAPIAVAETTPGEILVLDAAGKLLRWTDVGCAQMAVSLSRPTGIAVSRAMTLIADPGTAEIVVLAPTGAEIARWTGGSADHGFEQPTDVAIGADGSVFVVDGIRSRVVRLSADGRWQGEFGVGELARAKGIHVDVANRILVSDAERDEIAVFGGNGARLLTIGSPGAGPGEFAHPAGLAGAGRRILVADSLNRRVQVLESTGANE